MTTKSPEALKRRRDISSEGNGKFAKEQVYFDTLSYSEAMESRGYRLVDGKWVP